MKTIKGDLIQLALQGEFDAIAHGCNCHNMMGAGIALQIRKAFPGTYQIDTQYSQVQDDYNKLGTISVCDVEQYNDKQDLTKQTGSFTVINAYTQFDGGRNLDYDALKMCLKKINHYFKGKKIGLPQIGCGIAGGNWNIAKRYIEQYLSDCDVTIVEYSR